MRHTCSCVRIIALITLCYTSSRAEDLTQDKAGCADMGFKEPSCSDCDTMNDYINDASLNAECHMCCTSIKEASSSKFRSAVLEVCRHRIREFPHVETFANQHSSKYPKLQIRYVFGSPPRLTLKSGSQQETIRIDHWKTEHIEEYLNDRLLPTSSI